jgi:hypothetical protein
VCIKCVLFINIKCGYVRVQVSLTAIEGAGVFVWESAMQTESTPPMKKIYKDWRRKAQKTRYQGERIILHFQTYTFKIALN